jgi:hypothetical protein
VLGVRLSIIAAATWATALGLIVTRTVRAQEIVPGVRIRSWVAPPGEWHTGTLVRYGTDSVVIQRCPECATDAQSWAHITRVEVSEGRSWSGRHMAIGALVGGALAALIAKRSVDRDLARCQDGPCAIGVIAIPVAGILGAVSGIALGALWRAESWREVYGTEGAPARE